MRSGSVMFMVLVVEPAHARRYSSLVSPDDGEEDSWTQPRRPQPTINAKTAPGVWQLVVDWNYFQEPYIFHLQTFFLQLSPKRHKNVKY